mmetsp:Transcript_22476/g.48950  ORF Transcript_22476/g.48950 Transcript_22476/m.48950 type:complete len:581 (+) Transcript_22476:464-2206(+)|eukprot:CAMPEP_0168732882 /NCGR_PEP_ID=MMETSP0724-20121128/7995_1 /TAXON_ID=265536 /ORGANISM="Amphiprora sp., Strain CCMP467" /LENGTH=580 /DNA_ID=CAMNT_0008779905 /DNA_START=426 /DNA_END=2168 /DNA_ORIENTATION=-
MSLSHGQMVAIELAPKFGAFLSLLGSSLIIYRLLVHGRTELRTRTGHRILLAMSCVDIPNSIQFFLSSWAAPRDAPGQVWAVGTQGTCSMQAFFGHLGIAMPAYNVAMSAYYYLTVVHSWREHDFIGKWPEFLMHFFPLGFAFGTGLAGLIQKLYAYSGSWCWIAPDPPDCLESFHNNGVTTCERGDNWSIYRWAYWYAPLWACLLAITVLQYVLYRKVRGIERKADKWNAEHAGDGEYSDFYSDRERSFASERTTDNNNNNTPNDNSNNNNEQEEQQPQSLPPQQRRLSGPRRKSQQQQQQGAQKKLRNSQRVMGQCLAYAMAAYGTFIIPTTNRIVTQATGEYYFALGLMHALIEPTQGIWNYLVFNRPRYLRYRHQFPEDGVWVALWVTLTTFGATHVRKYESSQSSFSVNNNNNNLRSSKRFSFMLRNTTDNATMLGKDNDDTMVAGGRTDSTDSGKKNGDEDEDVVVDVDEEKKVDDVRVGKVSFLTASGTYYGPMNASQTQMNGDDDDVHDDSEGIDDNESAAILSAAAHYQDSQFEIVDADEPEFQLYGKPGASTRMLQIPSEEEEDEDDSLS